MTGGGGALRIPNTEATESIPDVPSNCAKSAAVSLPVDRYPAPPSWVGPEDLFVSLDVNQHRGARGTLGGVTVAAFRHLFICSYRPRPSASALSFAGRPYFGEDSN